MFKYGLTYVQHHENVQKFLDEDEHSIHFFPSKEFSRIVELKHEADRFSIYDVFKNEVVRKVPKDVKGNVFACDSDAT